MATKILGLMKWGFKKGKNRKQMSFTKLPCNLDTQQPAHPTEYALTRQQPGRPLAQAFGREKGQHSGLENKS